MSIRARSSSVGVAVDINAANRTKACKARAAEHLAAARGDQRPRGARALGVRSDHRCPEPFRRHDTDRTQLPVQHVDHAARGLPRRICARRLGRRVRPDSCPSPQKRDLRSRLRMGPVGNAQVSDPHSPYQRGSIENHNGHIRFWLPRGTRLDTLTDQRALEIATHLNHQPRRSLDWQTPAVLYAHAAVMH